MTKRDPFDSRIEEILREMMQGGMVGDTNVRRRKSRRQNSDPRRRDPKTKTDEDKEAMFEVLDYEDEIKIVTELPDVSRKDFNLDIDEDTVEIKVRVENSEKGGYGREFDLPAKIDPETAKTNFNNRILEVSAEKRV